MKVIVICAILCLSVVSAGESWEAIAHYQLGVEAGGKRFGSFQNLADSWPSHAGWSGLWGITEWFAWSHAVQRTGRTDGIPNQPVDAIAQWDAGKTMYLFYKRGGINGPEAYETALGFLMHLAQDQRVHYRYFRGGSIPNWIEEHRYKEQWADCLVYQLAVYRGGAGDDGFDKDGRPLKLPLVENRGNAKLIARAQQEFVASGLSTDLDEQVTIQPEDVGQITKRMGDHQAAIRKYLRGVSRAHCDQFKRLARRYNWNTAELREYYERSLAATRQILQAFPE